MPNTCNEPTSIDPLFMKLTQGELAGTANEILPEPLKVQLIRGCTKIANAVIRFEVFGPDGADELSYFLLPGNQHAISVLRTFAGFADKL
mgnify:CR=1 FL=1